METTFIPKERLKFAFKLKKLATIVLLLVYSTGAFGISVEYHVCNMNLGSISLFNTKDHHNCGFDRKGACKHCCQDKRCYTKSDAHLATPQLSIANWLVFFKAANSPKNVGFPLVVINFANNLFDLSRRSFSRPKFLLNRVFRI